MNTLRPARFLPALALSLAAVGLGLPGAPTPPAEAQEPGSAPPTSGSAIGDVFFGPDHVARTRSNIHGRSLVDAAMRRNRRDAAERGDERGIDRPGGDDRRRARPRGGARHFAGGRMVIVLPPDARARDFRPPDSRRSVEPRRARRSPDVSASLGKAESDSAAARGPRAPSAAAGRIGRHLRRAGADAGEAGPPGCASVEVETGSGIGFETRIDPAALGVDGPEEVGRLLRRRLDRNEPLVLPGVEGEAMSLPARGIDAVVVGPCR